jgi:predicted transcriptional regulator
MKTAISLPDDLYNATDRLATRLNKSRSRLVSDALREYLDRHDPDRVTAAFDRVAERTETAENWFATRSAEARLRDVEW